MKHIPTPMSCAKGPGRNLCRAAGGYGIDLRTKFYNEIGLSKEHINNIKKDETFPHSQYFWEGVYHVLKTHYEELLDEHMVEVSKIPDLWNQSGLSKVKPLECRINDKKKCNKKDIEKFINSVMKNDKITDIDILENQFLNMVFWDKIDGTIETWERIKQNNP